MKIEGRTFIVSGGSSGLGLATVERLHALGAYVSILDVSDAPAPVSGWERIRSFKTDICKAEEVARAVEGTVEWTRESGGQLGGVINAAGVGQAGKVIDATGKALSAEVFKRTLGINVLGTFNVTQLACKHLVGVAPSGADGERGVVVMVSSSAAFEGQVGQTAYAASKGAVRAMTLPLARELGRHGIRVATIAPGVFATRMTAGMGDRTRQSLERETVFPRRFGAAEEFAETVRWVLECGYVNGDTVRLSGAGRLPARM